MRVVSPWWIPQNYFKIFWQQTTHTLNFTHSPFHTHFDYAGLAADGLFTGPSRHICTLCLDGSACYVFIQEHLRVAKLQQRFPVLDFWKMATNDLWSLTDRSRLMTNHGICPLQVPSIGRSDPKFINTNAKSALCR